MAEMSATHKRTARTDCNRATRRDRCRVETGSSAYYGPAAERASADNRPTTEGACARRGTEPAANSAAAEAANSAAEAAVADTKATTSAGGRYIGRKQDYGRRCEQCDDRSAQHVTNSLLAPKEPFDCKDAHFERSRIDLARVSAAPVQDAGQQLAQQWTQFAKEDKAPASARQASTAELQTCLKIAFYAARWNLGADSISSITFRTSDCCS